MIVQISTAKESIGANESTGDLSTKYSGFLILRGVQTPLNAGLGIFGGVHFPLYNGLAIKGAVHSPQPTCSHSGFGIEGASHSPSYVNRILSSDID